MPEWAGIWSRPNFDLIPYWIINQINQKNKIIRLVKQILHSDSGENEWRDGFCIQQNGFLEWYKDTQNINFFYLHGGLHLIKQEKEVFKLQSHGGKTLNDIINKLNSNITGSLESIVFEGTHTEKLKVIEGIMYLTFCLNELKNIKGDLMIYGCSILNHDNQLNNDRHIWDSIFNNHKLDKIYISIQANSKFEFLKKIKIIRSAIETANYYAMNNDIIQFFIVGNNYPNIWKDKV